MIVLAGLVVAAGGLVQGAAGFGLALVAVPLLALIDPAYVPVPGLVLALAHAAATLAREPGHADWRGVGWSTLGGVPGTVAGVAAVVILPPQTFAAVLAGLVLLSCALSVSPVPVRPVPSLLVAAGLVSGVSGTAAAISGPPMALLYQSEAGPRIRATMGAFFAVSTAVSLGALAAAGVVDGAGLWQGVLLVPFLLLGFVASNRVRHLLDRGWTRPAVLVISVASAVLLLARAVWG